MPEYKKITTPPFRISFPEVFKAKAFEEGQDPKFSCMMCFPKDTTDMSELKAEIKRVAQEKWGKKRPKKFMQPIKDGADLDLDGMENFWTVRASSNRKPGIVDKNLNLITEEEAEEVYAGAWFRATINAFVFDRQTNKGVSFGLNNLQKIKDDESFVGSVKPQDDFDEIEDSDDESEEDWG